MEPQTRCAASGPGVIDTQVDVLNSLILADPLEAPPPFLPSHMSSVCPSVLV